MLVACRSGCRCHRHFTAATTRAGDPGRSLAGASAGELRRLGQASSHGRYGLPSWMVDHPSERCSRSRPRSRRQCRRDCPHAGSGPEAGEHPHRVRILRRHRLWPHRRPADQRRAGTASAERIRPVEARRRALHRKLPLALRARRHLPADRQLLRFRPAEREGAGRRHLVRSCGAQGPADHDRGQRRGRTRLHPRRRRRPGACGRRGTAEGVRFSQCRGWYRSLAE